MASVKITDRDYNENNLIYVKNTLSEIFSQTHTKAEIKQLGSRSVLTIELCDYYKDILKSEIYDKVADVISINYKYEYFKKHVNPSGLNEIERELLLTSLISADLEEDKKYALDKIKGFDEIAIDGIYNFRMVPLKKKLNEIISYMPDYFINSQLKEFIAYLIEGKQKRIYIDDNVVYDMHYRRLKKGDLMDRNIEDGKIIREVILSGGGEIELNSKISLLDEKYLKEFYGDKVIISKGYFS